MSDSSAVFVRFRIESESGLSRAPRLRYVESRMEERSTDSNSVGEELAERALGGDESALADAFELHRTRLRRMIDLRIDP